jgi:hypothetical protein
LTTPFLSLADSHGVIDEYWKMKIDYLSPDGMHRYNVNDYTAKWKKEKEELDAQYPKIP